jgi:photosystem II stability/assembly factor-like uncharacterized protein
VSSPTSLLSIDSGSPLVWFAVGVGGAIRTTTDSGLTWSLVNSGTTATLNSVYCVTATACWAVGSAGTIRRGPGWSAQNSGVTRTLYGVYFINGNIGWAVGSDGTVRRTINGGVVWK